MLKTISAALLAVSVLAAPALAASSDKTTQAPASKTAQVPADKATQVKPKAAQVKPNADQAKSKALNANAKMGHHPHYRHHRSHKHVGALKTHKFSKVTIKHVAPATKRG
jgi:hypothetical protein